MVLMKHVEYSLDFIYGCVHVKSTLDMVYTELSIHYLRLQQSLIPKSWSYESCSTENDF